MDPNEFKKRKSSSSSAKSSSSGNDGEIFGDDEPQHKKIIQTPNVSNVSLTIQQTSVVRVFTNNENACQQIDNQSKQSSQKHSSMSSKTRPVIYDQVQRHQDNYGSGKYHNTRQNYRDYDRQEQNYRNYPQKYRHQGYQRRQYRNRRQNNYQDRRRENERDFRYNRWNYNDCRNNFQQDREFHFQHQRQNFGQYQNSYPRQYQRQDCNYQQSRENQHEYEQQYIFQTNYRRQNHKSIPNNRSERQRQDSSRQIHQASPSRNDQRQRQHSNSSSNHQFQMRNQSKQQDRQNLDQEARQESQNSQIKPSKKQGLKKAQIDVKRPQKENPQINQQRKYQPSQKQQPRKPALSHQISSPSQTTNNNNSDLNEANSQITFHNTNCHPKSKQKQEQSLWQPSDEQDQQESYQKPFDKQSFECHQISLEYPLPPPIVAYNTLNMSSMIEDLSLLDALNIGVVESVSIKQDRNSLVIQPIPYRRQEKSSQKQPSQSKKDKSIFTKNDLQILEKMFDAIPLQGQTVFVELRVRTSSVLSYKIKDLSSELYLIQNITLQELKAHKFISIKQPEKLIPRDPEPHYHLQPNEKIELKSSKLILAQIKNPLQLLNHKQELLKKFDSFQDSEVIKKIEKNKKIIAKVSCMINIEQVTLKCSSCNGKKSFLWKDQIITHQCKAQCANFLRFDIDSISIC